MSEVPGQNRIYLNHTNWATRDAMIAWLQARGATLRQARLTDSIRLETSDRTIRIAGDFGIAELPFDVPE